MAASLIGGAAVGAVFGELLKAVLEVKDRAVAFKQTLIYLQSTLIAIAPVIKEMEQHNNDLGRPKEELESVIREMEEGTKLVCKCSIVHRLNYVARFRCQKQLEALVSSLERFLTIDIQAQTARDQKETLIKVRRILSAIKKLPLVFTEDTASESAASESATYYTATTQLDDENAVEIISSKEAWEHISHITRSSSSSSSYDSRPVWEHISHITRSSSYDSRPVLINVNKLDTPHSTGNKFAKLSAYSDDSVLSQSLQIVPAQNKGSLRVLLLHGNLDVCVHGARNLPNMYLWNKTFGDMFGRLPGNVRNRIEGAVSRKITSDPYVSISLSNAVIGRTFAIRNSENPVWDQHFYVPVAHHAAEMHFVIKDSDVVGSQLIGIVAIPVKQIYSGERVQRTYHILNDNGKPCKPGAVLRVSIQYIPMEKLSIYHQGIGAGPDYIGVPGTYFPLRKGGSVTLYQDAHVPDGCLPNVMLDRGMYYAHGKCWLDIFDAIRQAQRLIYITGWSVWHKVRLVRDAGHASNSTLGDLLRSKSQDGVRVLLLVWDDPTSRSILGYKTVSNAIFYVTYYCISVFDRPGRTWSAIVCMFTFLVHVVIIIMSFYFFGNLVHRDDL